MIQFFRMKKFYIKSLVFLNGALCDTNLKLLDFNADIRHQVKRRKMKNYLNPILIENCKDTISRL